MIVKQYFVVVYSIDLHLLIARHWIYISQLKVNANNSQINIRYTMKYTIIIDYCIYIRQLYVENKTSLYSIETFVVNIVIKFDFFHFYIKHILKF